MERLRRSWNKAYFCKLFCITSGAWYFFHLVIRSNSLGMMISGCASIMAPTKLWLLRWYPMNSTNVSTPLYNLKSSLAGEGKCDSAEKNRSNSDHEIKYHTKDRVIGCDNLIKRKQYCTSELLICLSIFFQRGFFKFQIEFTHSDKQNLETNDWPSTKSKTIHWTVVSMFFGEWNWRENASNYKIKTTIHIFPMRNDLVDLYVRFSWWKLLSWN